ncbi:HlyD family efflux transporter periplasmic adaptor subunit [Planosporangium thailandense]|uniref:HlyD family efflux transporter periplasmic adaptor subunit n=1 Tax=Planosporangium thailandense TaxID=765197 RepID=A0ABX0Y2Q3_9ACTN|nr:efflux RND transporter periplasmic adaptor subunit [Planosporangium thailandense]NJC71705.1 HlyD family efflux transporter periplasmic adaptor subunit [Planosporangium thailandense]
MRSRLPVRLPWRGPALWATLVLVVVGATAGTAIAYAGRQTPVANRQTTVRVQRGVVELTASAAGTVQAAQSRGLSFSVGGVVTEVDVTPGDSVTAGQVLARIDSTSAQDDVNTAQANVNSASDALTRVQQTTAPAAPTGSNCQGAAVQAAPAAYRVTGATAPSSAGPSTSTSSTPSASASSTPSASASSTPSASASSTPSAKPSRTGAPSASATTRPGPSRGAGSGGTPQSGSGGRGGTGGCAGSGGGSNGSGSGGARSGSGDSLMSAEQQLTNAQLSLQLAQDRLAGTTITAAVAGKVLSVAGTVGTQETPGGSGFIVLGDVADTIVQAEFSEADVAHLAVGQTATITLPDRDGAQFKGKVSQIDPAGTTSGRLVRYGVQITFDQVPADLLLGQSANVAVVTASAADARYASSAAVRSVSGGKGVVTVLSGGRTEQRTVQVGLRGDQYTEIRSGVQEGDELVVPGSR